MPRPKGLPKTGGRKKGTPNRITGDARADYWEAYRILGGVKFLVSVGRADPVAFFRGFTAKMLPSEVKADLGADWREATLEAYRRGSQAGDAVSAAGAVAADAATEDDDDADAP